MGVATCGGETIGVAVTVVDAAAAMLTVVVGGGGVKISVVVIVDAVASASITRGPQRAAP